jgi:hypothetical protein
MRAHQASGGPFDPSPDVTVLLAEIEADPTNIFWG